MASLMRGALVEYSDNFLGPLPNVVLFQFNPEEMTRTISVPNRPAGSAARERSQAGELPQEQLSFTARFAAADLIAASDPIAQAFGVGPQIAALELMANPKADDDGLVGKVVDAVSSALGGSSGSDPSQSIPREQYPKVIFIWGVTRVLPVMITSMTVAEKNHDFLLNVTEAEVQLGLTVATPDPCSDDVIAQGARTYTATAREVQSIANLGQNVAQVVDLIPL